MKQTSALFAAFLGACAIFLAMQDGLRHPLAGVDESPAIESKQEAMPPAAEKQAEVVPECAQCIDSPVQSSSSVSSSSSSVNPTSAPVITTVPVVPSTGGGLSVENYSSVQSSSSSSSSNGAAPTVSPLAGSSSSASSDDEEVADAVAVPVTIPVRPALLILRGQPADLLHKAIAAVKDDAHSLDVSATIAGLDVVLPVDPSAPVQTSQLFSIISSLAGEDASIVVDDDQSYPTRAATIAAVLEEFDVPLSKRRPPFRDVARTNPYADAIATAKQMRLITGDTGENAVQLKTFRPNDPVSAAEVRLIARRLVRLGFAKKF